MKRSKRILTKLTLLPFHFFIQFFYLVKKEKNIWLIDDTLYQKLKQKWCKIKSAKTLPIIHFQKRNTELIQQIKKQTEHCNQNNITRTAAYLTFFKKHPEIHWAFLAHMVSRNAGYFMTDLKGEFLPHLIEHSTREKLYEMLEKGNSLIFQDAFPQLLLYEESKKEKQSLFYLCKYFNVSPFMEGIWELCFDGEVSPLLPVAQIINEQNHIEQHLIQTEEFQSIKNSLPFRLQNWLQLSQILFPVIPFKKATGKTMMNFENLNKRISLGKNLYVLLFQNNIYDRIFKFACSRTHTGSRKDYDPAVFTSKSLQKEQTKEKLSFFKTKNAPIYSPELLNVWKEPYTGPFSSSSWFSNFEIDPSLFSLDIKANQNVWLTYWAGLHKTEAAYLLKAFYQNKKKMPN
ncbi:DUF2515 family protein [Fictibacillus barbaricus]|uniref:DUF2515 domain-containing protein n=1 Tax=Fictibacillus barbaricus TaxID=182136 RepID=A0ABU1TYS5_9BACL|nr:DUF2515 family protein [Fictibacillus barbaricus]MDR7072337.1 hypothetical protein [Fictibacillus barbaricus]